MPWTRSAGLLMPLPSVTEARISQPPSVSKGRHCQGRHYQAVIVPTFLAQATLRRYLPPLNTCDYPTIRSARRSSDRSVWPGGRECSRRQGPRWRGWRPRESVSMDRAG